MQAPSHVKILHGEKERIIENDLKNILSHKATGLDGISVHILKEALPAALHKKRTKRINVLCADVMRLDLDLVT